MPTAATVPLAAASGTAGRPARCEATGSSSATSRASNSLSTSAETVARVSPVAAAMSARETGDGASSTCRRVRARLWWRRLSWRAGRPAVPLAAARGTVAAVGMEVNVDYLGVRAIDLGGRVLTERVELGDFRGSNPEVVLDRLAALADPVLALLSEEGVMIAGTALALPGLVDSITGPLRLAPNLRWRDVDVVGILAADPVLAGMPPRLANEANLAARAEARARRGSPSSFVYVSGEVGVGGQDPH